MVSIEHHHPVQIVQMYNLWYTKSERKEIEKKAENSGSRCSFGSVEFGERNCDPNFQPHFCLGVGDWRSSVQQNVSSVECGILCDVTYLLLL